MSNEVMVTYALILWMCTPVAEALCRWWYGWTY